MILLGIKNDPKKNPETALEPAPMLGFSRNTKNALS
jgi:hypothetical protein